MLDFVFKALPLLLAAAGFVWTTQNYLDVRRRELKKGQMDQYRSVVRQLLTDSEVGDAAPFIDLQIAAVHELKMMPARYNNPSLSILNRIRSRNTDPELLSSIDEAIKTLSGDIGSKTLRSSVASADLAIATGLATGLAIFASQLAFEWLAVSQGISKPIVLMFVVALMVVALLVCRHLARKPRDSDV